MAIIAGIDEAGFGPVLGPLVVSAAAFEVPDEVMDNSLWKLLAGTVSKKPPKRRWRVAIADSKRLYSGSDRTLEHLERGVLSVLSTAGIRPATLGELLTTAAPGCTSETAGYPWYADLGLALPACISATDRNLAGNSLQVAMERAGVRLLGVRCEPIFAGEYNRIVGSTRNKSVTLFDVSARLLVWLWRVCEGGRMRVVADRQGGRMRYLPGLQRVLAGCDFKILDETETLSAYRVGDGLREAEIRFAVNGDETELPTALASMVSKYVRELCMSAFNAYWSRHVPELKPTAGYFGDGTRFWRQIRPALHRLGIEETLVYRAR